MSNRKITVLGGDKRNLALAKLLAKDGIDVTLYGYDHNKFSLRLKKAENLENAIESSNIIIGPLPFSNKNNLINTPFYSDEIFVEDVFKYMRNEQILFAGKIANEWMELAKDFHIKMVDYFNREELQILNAIPTSEGAIQLAMEKMDTTLHSSNVLVLGFGRIGKVLSKMLDGLGVNVYVGSSDPTEIASIKSCRYEPVLLNKVEKYLPNMDLIINTIPALILNKEKLKKTNGDAIIIDLASFPGGVDFDMAEKLHIKTIRALGLPGKVAPISSASYIKETIYRMMDELEV